MTNLGTIAKYGGIALGILVGLFVLNYMTLHIGGYGESDPHAGMIDMGEYGWQTQAAADKLNATFDAAENGNEGGNEGDDEGNAEAELQALTEYISTLPVATDDSFNDAWDGPAILGEEDAVEVRVFAPGDSEKIAALVKSYGIPAVWNAIRKAPTSTAFLWQRAGFSDQIKTAEQEKKNQFSLKLNYFKIENSGTISEIEETSKIANGGKLYGIDYDFQ